MNVIKFFFLIAMMGLTIVSCKKENDLDPTGSQNNSENLAAMAEGTYNGTLFINSPEVIIHDSYEWKLTRVDNNSIKITGEHLPGFEFDIIKHPTIAGRLDVPLSYYEDMEKVTWYYEDDKKEMHFMSNDQNYSFYGKKVD